MKAGLGVRFLAGAADFAAGLAVAAVLAGDAFLAATVFTGAAFFAGAFFAVAIIESFQNIEKLPRKVIDFFVTQRMLLEKIQFDSGKTLYFQRGVAVFPLKIKKRALQRFFSFNHTSEILKTVRPVTTKLHQK